MTFRGPTKDEAIEFAAMLRGGAPACDVVPYFAPAELAESEKADWCKRALEQWPQHPLVTEALAAKDGGQWHRLDADSQQQIALKKHYAEMAYFLMTNNFAEVTNPPTIAKLNTCRDTLEKKVAGMAGKSDPLYQYMQDALNRMNKKADEQPEALH